MGTKEILGFKEKKFNDSDGRCPNCGWEINIPLRVEKQSGFLGIHLEHYDEYTCSQCGLQWIVR